MYLPSESASSLFGLDKRYCSGYNCYNYNSSWSNWGRYVVLAGVIIVAIVIFVVMACVTARRRRNRGAQPYYGTGWLAGHGNVNYYPNGGNTTQSQQPYYGGNQQYGSQPYAQPAPPYSPGGTQQPPYYGSRAEGGGIELQPPQESYQPQSYTADDGVYAPPSGPPPGKKGDVIR